ncbi:MAG TPA: HD domain-containing phosphohydrolase [Vicinamibacterales bacterium]|nr:HD domain-containing phosphohydrolase [Vicinamibacterales bacterium]
MTRLLWFTAPIIGLGLIVIGVAVWQLPATPNPAGWMVLGALALAVATFAIKIPRVSAFISISDTFWFASVLLFGPAPATVSIALDSLLLSWRRRFRAHQLLFNPASSALALWCGAQLYDVLGGPAPLAETATTPAAAMFIPLAAMAGLYFLLNSGMTVMAVALDKGIAPIKLWREHFAIISLNYFAAASASFFLIVLIQYAGITAFIAIVPLISICYLAMRSWLGRVEDANRHVDKVNQMYLSTIGAFSTAIEAKDGVTSEHVQRVQAYALGLARALGITDSTTTQALEAAALLHDTGKLAVPEHILNKPGRLTPAEFATMQLHVDVGADILSSIDFPYPVVPIVRAHHENWDGSGYPRGLSGEDIPIGARILSVVDCFDALTSDRPYRSALSERESIDIILERRGTMYDPQVVDTFVRVYRDIIPRVETQPVLQNALGRIRRVHQPIRQLPAASADDDGLAPDCSDELLAFVSLAKVTSRSASHRDVGILAWGYLRHLAPRTTFALLTVDATRGALAPQYTAGPAAHALEDLSIEVGHRVSGWVAANWRPMFNADARLDLDDRDTDLRYAASMPLIDNERLVGVLALYGAEPFGDAQARRLEMITPHVAAALASVGEAGQGRAVSRELKVVARR